MKGGISNVAIHPSSLMIALSSGDKMATFSIHETDVKDVYEIEQDITTFRSDAGTVCDIQWLPDGQAFSVALPS